MKRCNKCGETKEESDFYKVTKRGVTRLRAICKVCSKAQLRDRSGDPKPDGRTCTECGIFQPLSRFHRHRTSLYGVEPICKVCRLRKRREYREKFPARVRNTELQVRYGITLDDYAEIFTMQGGKCAICYDDESQLKVDHNHATGKARGLLCHLCNAALGCARDDIRILLRAAAYLYSQELAGGAEVRAELVVRGVGDVELARYGS